MAFHFWLLNKEKMMNTDIIKTATGMLVSTGVGMIVKNAVKATTPEDLKRSKKILIAVGGFALAGMASSASVDYLEGQIDKVNEGISAGLRIQKNLAERKVVDVHVDTEAIKEEVLDGLPFEPTAYFHPDGRVVVAENREESEVLDEDGFYPTLADARYAAERNIINTDKKEEN